jgi:hypothetical protein
MSQVMPETAYERFERITGEQERRAIEGQRERLERLRTLRPTCLKVGEVDRDFRLALDAVVFDSEVVKVTHGGRSKVLGVLLSDDDYNALFRAAMLKGDDTEERAGAHSSHPYPRAVKVKCRRCGLFQPGVGVSDNIGAYRCVECGAQDCEAVEETASR